MTSKSNKPNTTINEDFKIKLKEPETITSTSTTMTSKSNNQNTSKEEDNLIAYSTIPGIDMDVLCKTINESRELWKDKYEKEKAKFELANENLQHNIDMNIELERKLKNCEEIIALQKEQLKPINEAIMEHEQDLKKIHQEELEQYEEGGDKYCEIVDDVRREILESFNDYINDFSY